MVRSFDSAYWDHSNDQINVDMRFELAQMFHVTVSHVRRRKSAYDQQTVSSCFRCWIQKNLREQIVC